METHSEIPSSLSSSLFLLMVYQTSIDPCFPAHRTISKKSRSWSTDRGRGRCILTRLDRRFPSLIRSQRSVTCMCVSRNTWPSSRSHASLYREGNNNATASDSEAAYTRRSITHRCKHTRSSSTVLVHRCMPPLPAADVTLRTRLVSNYFFVSRGETPSRFAAGRR